MQPGPVPERGVPGRVSILTRPGGRVQQTFTQITDNEICVSILTRPGGRVQRRWPYHLPNSGTFQSSPDPEVGCNALAGFGTAGLRQFQSSPDPEVGCNELTKIVIGGLIEFQSSPDPEVGCNATPIELINLRRQGVSILTRPGGRVQPQSRGLTPFCLLGFNPHPTRRSGATLPSVAFTSPMARFNPHPTRRSGATLRSRSQ